MASRTEVYVVETELQLKGALSISENCQKSSYFFTDNIKLYNYLLDAGRSVWLVKKAHAAGRLGKILKIARYVNQVVAVLPVSERYFLAIPRLDSLYNNALYSRLKSLYGNALDTALLPDGVMSYYTGGMTDKLRRKLISYGRWLFILTLGKQRISPYQGNLMGGDEVDHVYHFGSIAPEVSADCRSVSAFDSFTIIDSGKRNILIVGQNLLALNKEDSGFIDTVTKKISTLAAGLGAKKIYYAKHPRAMKSEFCIQGAVAVECDYLCLEDVVGKYGITDVFSCSSSVLFNTKSMLAGSINCYSVGLEASSHLDDQEKKTLRNLYMRSGVVLVSI